MPKNKITKTLETAMEIEIPIGNPQMSVQLIPLDTYAVDPVTKMRTARSNLIWIHREKEPAHLDPLGQREPGLAAYRRELPRFLAEFKKMLAQRSWDLVLEAPSSKPHAKQFAEAAREMRERIPSIVFLKSPGVSATTGASVADIKAALSHEPKIGLQQFSDVLVVDDVFNDGKTVAAMILYLREHGLNPTTKITVAVALHVPRRMN